MEVIDAGTLVFRIHTIGLGPIFFGPRAGDPPASRFDAPDGSFRVCYFGETDVGAFAETMLRSVPVRLVSRSLLATRAIVSVALSRPIRVVDLHGSGLAKVGTTAAINAGDHASAREWAKRLHAHPDAADGLRFRCRHDSDALAIALFDRAGDAVPDKNVLSLGSLESDAARLAAWLDRYQLGLDP